MNDKIRIVLDKTSHPGNIGAIARAMKNMGLAKLVLVQPKQFPCAEASARASGAIDILDNAVVVDKLADAFVGCDLVIACSARRRSLDWPILSPRAAAVKAVAHVNGAEIAFLFGNEQAGLSNEELAHCHYQLSIPSVEGFSSLNLSHAVQVVVYEIFVALNSDLKPATSNADLASSEELENFYQHLREAVETIGFYQPAKSTQLMQRLKRLFSRVQLEHKEVQILRGILTAAERHVK